MAADDKTMADVNLALSNYQKAASTFAAIPTPCEQSCIKPISAAADDISEGRKAYNQLTQAASDLNESQKRIDALNQSISALTTINGQITALSNAISVAQGLINKPGRSAADIKSFADQIANLQNTTADLNNQIKSMGGKYTTLQEQLAAEKQNSDTIQMQINFLYVALQGGGGPAGYNNTILSHIDEYNACVKALQPVVTTSTGAISATGAKTTTTTTGGATGASGAGTAT